MTEEAQERERRNGGEKGWGMGDRGGTGAPDHGFPPPTSPPAEREEGPEDLLPPSERWEGPEGLLTSL